MAFKNRILSVEEERILKRAVRELKTGMLVNLGIGLPTHIPAFLAPEIDVTFHSENGFVGMGEQVENGTPDNNIIDAGGRACNVIPGAVFFDSLLSFAIVRGGNLDVAILGAFEVSLKGDLANWKIPGKLTPGMGGGMELAQKANQVVVICRHADKHGRAKLVEECKLPLTACHCVDTMITERALFRRKDGILTLSATAPGETVKSIQDSIDLAIPVANEMEAWE